MRLTERQRQQVAYQLEQHDRGGGRFQIEPDESGSFVLSLRISRGVFASDIMSSGAHMSKYLFLNPALYKDKTALDMGCGAGVLGLIMAMNGASEVVLADINPKAIEDARFNTAGLNLGNVKIYQSDLFDSIPRAKYDLIIFNHPFFAETPEGFKGNQDLMLKQSMLGGEVLLPRFFSDVKRYLNPSGKLIMPFYHLAGEQNNPKNRGMEADFKVSRELRFSSSQGIQQGDFSIYILLPKDTPVR